MVRKVCVGGIEKSEIFKSLKRVGAGKGSAADKINASSQLSLANYIRGGGLNGSLTKKGSAARGS